MAQIKITEHLGLILSAAALVMTGMKVTAVAHGDPITVAAIIEAQGLGLLPAVLLTGASTFTLLPFVFSSQFLGEAIRDRDPVGRLPALCAGTFAVAALVADMLFLAAAFLWAAGFVLTGLLWRVTNWQFLSVKPQESPLSAGPVLGVLIALAVLATVLDPRPWLPKESVRDEEGTIVGYVLENEGGTLTMLEDDGRRVLRIHEGEVSARWLCRTGAAGKPLLAWLLWRDERPYRSCPDGT